MSNDTGVHTCSYYCERPGCVRRQRDELRDRMGLGMNRMESALAQQPEIGEEIMVNAGHDVFTLPLQLSGLSSGPRFVVHVPAPEQQPAATAARDAEIAALLAERDALAAALEAARGDAERMKRAIADLLLYFKSGNSIPVEKATIKAGSPEIVTLAAFLGESK